MMVFKLALILTFPLALQAQASAVKCQSVFTESTKRTTTVATEASQNFKVKAIQLMLDGSKMVSNSVVSGRTEFWSYAKGNRDLIKQISNKNFEKTARYIVNNFESLPITLETAVIINTMLTKGLVPESNLGDPYFRFRLGTDELQDHFVGKGISSFYDWLVSPAGLTMKKVDPVKFAEVIHNNIVAFDSFPDGNGRLSRMLSDLALLQAGMAPAAYTEMQNYFDIGNANSKVSRQERELYYREIVRRGQEILREDR